MIPAITVYVECEEHDQPCGHWHGHLTADHDETFALDDPTVRCLTGGMRCAREWLVRIVLGTDGCPSADAPAEPVYLQ